MKKFIFSLIKAFCFSVLLFTLPGCKKEVNPQTFFSFTYNGKQYNFGEHKVGPNGGSIGPEQEWLADDGVWINRPDIFGGIINYRGPDCTFLSPVINDIVSLYNCQLTSNGIPVDSVSVYFYKSGNHIFKYENCITKSVYDIVNGRNIDERTCDVIGTFDLELVNKENRIIRITGGKYKYSILCNSWRPC